MNPVLRLTLWVARKDESGQTLRRKNHSAATPNPANAIVVGSGATVNTILSIVRVSVLAGPPHCQELSWKANCQVAPVGLAAVMLPKFTLKVCQALGAVNWSLTVAFMACEPPK